MKKRLLPIICTIFFFSACSLHPSSVLKMGRKLKINSQQMVEINSSTYWNDTGIFISSGKEYEFSLKNSTLWFDANVPSKACGYKKKKLIPFIPLRRMISAPWFAVICTIDFQDAFKLFDDTSCFDNYDDKTGLSRQTCRQSFNNFTKSGTLYCYANDVSFMYGNNNGILNINVKRLEEKEIDF